MASIAASSATPWVGIVDDDLSIRRALARAFRAHGIVTRTFGSAEEYLSRAVDDEPSCLVLDVRLGGMSGFELQAHLCASGSLPPIIFIAAMDEIPSSLLARMPGLHAFLRKPFETEALLALVHEYSASVAYDGAR
jgi:FixJ family two-component response regulator